MKKVSLLLIFTMILLICASCAGNETVAQEFDLADYSETLSTFPSDFKTEPIDSVSGVKKAAKTVWKDMFDGFISSDINYSYSYYFDKTNDVWMVRRKDKTIDFGGAMCLIIKSDGTALAAWGEK